MNHEDWIKQELEPLSKALGYKYVPKEEIEGRLKRLKEAMKKTDLEALLVIQKMDCYYLSGTAQDGFLFVPMEGNPCLMVKRELHRARIESPLEEVVGIESPRQIPSMIRDRLGRNPETLGMEMDILPVKDYFRYEALFPGTKIMDSSGIFRDLRKLKSPFEIDLMRRAGKIGEKVYHKAAQILKEGMTEIEFAGLMEAEAKVLGHEGLLRVRSINFEAYTWHILSGPTGGIVSLSDSPMGGLGLSPAFPAGASLRAMKAHEPIVVDFGTCYQGYQVDETRVFSIGRMEDKFLDAYKACREIHDAAIAEARPGADCETIFLNSVKLAEKLGYRDSYLGPPGLQTRFIAHGIGLELNDFPYIAQGHAYPLEEGMTFALEPKIVFAGEGAVGIENTVVVTRDGCEILTPLEQGIFEV